MIFVTVGTQLPFDRLISAVDEWAGARGRTDLFAQIGPASRKPAHFPSKDFISPVECRELMQKADAVVAHAGMGTILAALELTKPILILARRADLGEHRNDHQVATAKHFMDRPGVSVAVDERDLFEKLDRVESLATGPRIAPYASDRLIEAVRAFINDSGRRQSGAARPTSLGERSGADRQTAPAEQGSAIG